MNFVCGWNKEEYEMFNIDFNLSSSDINMEKNG